MRRWHVRTEREKPIVLIVDDGPEIIRFAVSFFSDVNHKVIQAIQHATTHTIVAFADIRLKQGPSGTG
jgi:hypothetical protein